jgi:hypothetical protein
VEPAAYGAEGFLAVPERFTSNSPGTVFASAAIDADASGEADLYVGSGDAVAVWINGEKVLDHETFRNGAADEDKSRIRLKQGANEVLVRLRKTIGAHRLYFRVERPTSGSPSLAALEGEEGGAP